jgi:hypothetical protein
VSSTFLGYFLDFWFLCAFCYIAGSIAESKGRSFWNYFFVSFFFTPVIGIVVALLITPDPKYAAVTALINGEAKKCPYCAEIIKQEARVCRYCGRDLPATKTPCPGPSRTDGLPSQE